MQLDHLTRFPFSLDAEALAWVRRTAEGLTLREQVGQLFVLLSRPGDAQGVRDMAELCAGGVCRYHGADLQEELGVIEGMLDAAKVPPLVAADLEGSRLSLRHGTEVLNPLGLAAVDDLEATRTIARISAIEGQALGVNWSFTPCVDINAAFRSAIVGTRSFGSRQEVVVRHGRATVEALQAVGTAACAKHFPGEGFDDRDQHLLTTCNPLSVAEWEASFGAIYRTMIAAGVLSVMSGHIAFPAWVRQFERDAQLEAYRPATLSHAINVKLLREHLGFNGLLVSDASEMAGLTSWQAQQLGKVDIIRHGCDMILFTRQPAADVQAVYQAVVSGEIPRERFEHALSRVLGLKARLGLHTRQRPSRAERVAALASAEHRAQAAAITARAPTLVKDVPGTLPITVAKHRRVLLVTTGVHDPMQGPQPLPLALPGLMRARGFEVTEHVPGQPIDPSQHDLVLYALAEETLLTRGRVFLNWNALGGHFVHAMRRTWHEKPTVLLSFGYPYYLYDAPRMPTVVNAYSTMDGMQAAALDALMGLTPLSGQSPVDAFCGLEDAHF